MSDNRWQTFWTAVGALATAAAVVVALVAANPSGHTDDRDKGKIEQEPPELIDPYAISLLRDDVAIAVQRAREAQAAGRAGANSARQAAARGREASQRASSGDSRFQIVTRSPEWRGERLQSGAIVFGVLRSDTGAATGEFRFEERTRSEPNGATARQARFVPLRHVAQNSQGTFEGTSTGQDSQWMGPGRYIFANGDMFEGEWQPGSSRTYGVMTYANGQRFEGEFEDLQQDGFDMQRHGLGVVWTDEGALSRQGRWVHGSPAD